MATSKITTSLFALAVLIIVPIVAWAGCKSDYGDAVQTCQLTYDDPDDADELAQCVQQAKDDYDDCVE